MINSEVSNWADMEKEKMISKRKEVCVLEPIMVISSMMYHLSSLPGQSYCEKCNCALKTQTGKQAGREREEGRKRFRERETPYTIVTRNKYKTNIEEE